MARLLARFSLKQLLVASFVLAALRWLLLGWLAADLPLLLSAQLLHAATFGCFHVTAVHLVQRSFGSEHRGRDRRCMPPCPAAAVRWGRATPVTAGTRWAPAGPSPWPVWPRLRRRCCCGGVCQPGSEAGL